jgi:FixJ family two-component response regulator
MSFKVLLVDDDAGVLKALSRVLRAAGYETRGYATAEEFLADYAPAEAGCVVLDLNLPQIDGLQLQQTLASSDSCQPIIFVSGAGDIPTSVRAMKAGAVDFLTKPVQRQELIAAVERARERNTHARQSKQDRDDLERRLAKLTPRERQVLDYVVAGQLNKQIAAALGTVEKTIKVHRGRMMAKLGMHNVAELVRLAERAGLQPRI